MTLITCACGCGQMIEDRSNYGRIRRYARGHNSNCKNIPKKDIIELYIGKKLSKRKTAKILDINHHTLQNYLDKYNIQRETFSEAHTGQIPICEKCGKKLNPKSSRKTRMCRRCFVISHNSKFKEPNIDDAFGNWLMGFTDGEGNFQYTNHRYAFRINLREDDLPVLQEIREHLGCGHINFLKKSKYNSNTRDQYQYQVTAIIDLIEIIIPLFDKYHLRAKKQVDYFKFRDTVMGAWSKINK